MRCRYRDYRNIRARLPYHDARLLPVLLSLRDLNVLQLAASVEHPLPDRCGLRIAKRVAKREAFMKLERR